MSEPVVASPCTGICKLDETTGWCLGCARSGDEIADWRTTPAAWRDDIWAQIPDRLAQLGVSCRRLPWTTADVRAFVRNTLNDGTGTWVVGVVGAVAEFTPATDEAVTFDATGDALVAHTKGGALRMVINDDVRALTFDPPGTPEDTMRVALAVKRERGRLPMADGISNLGPDNSPLITDDEGYLFDLGLARKEARFCVRTTDGPAQQALQRVLGQPFLDALPRIGAPLVTTSPTRVIETALGRIEVQGPIPAPSERSPDGPHTHLLPEHLKTQRAMPVGMDLPRAYLPGALFYPKRKAR